MDPVEEVKSHLDIVDIAAEYLQLKPAGTGSFRACCPFHQEKTPSFYVNRQRQSWHCFGCNKGGDAISFVMEIEGMDFRDALEHLAQKTGVTLPAFDTKAAGLRKRLHEINDLAARFFQTTFLQSPEAEHAREYATERGIDGLTGDLFRIGYAPQSWDALGNALHAKNVTDEELIAAGLAIPNQRGNGVHDRFRDRLMFPIQDVHGNVIGFTGRLLDKEAKEAKYVNTPETAVFKKSAVLYGLDKAKSAIKSEDLCVLVEGNMDALSSHRINVTNVVCPGGTALTADQLRLIARFTKNLAIAFDADAAGLAATLRGLDMARAQDFVIKIITLPPEAGKDPDEAITKDPAIWKEAIANASDIMDWIFRVAFMSRDLSSPDQKRQIARDILPEIKRIPDPIVRDHWIQKLARAINTSEEALRDALRAAVTRNAGQAGRTGGVGVKVPLRQQGIEPLNGNADSSPEARSPDEQATASETPRVRDLSERVISLLLAVPELRGRVPDDLTGMLPANLAALYKQYPEGYDSRRFNETSRPEAIFQAPEHNFDRLVNYLAIRFDRDYPNQNQKTLAEEFLRTISALRECRTTEALARLHAEMSAAEAAGDRVTIDRLMREFDKLLGAKHS